jgi:Fe-S cluster assembly protein SufD
VAGGAAESLQLAAGAASVLRPEPAAPGSGVPVGAPVAVTSRATRTTSFDLADFPVPAGREEEWRFTPLDRLRGLHDGTAKGDGKVVVEFDAGDGVTVEFVERGDARLGRAGNPGDRVAAQAWTSFERATVVSVPSETVATKPTVVAVRGEGGPDRPRTATCSSTSRRSRRRRSCSTTRAPRRTRRTSSCASATAPR